MSIAFRPPNLIGYRPLKSAESPVHGQSEGMIQPICVLSHSERVGSALLANEQIVPAHVHCGVCETNVSS